MNENDALDRLNGLLPLAGNQQRLPVALRELHRMILQGFAEHGHPPSREAMVEQLGDATLDKALQQLAADDLVVLSPDRREVTDAYRKWAPAFEQLTDKLWTRLGHRMAD